MTWLSHSKDSIGITAGVVLALSPLSSPFLLGVALILGVFSTIILIESLQS